MVFDRIENASRYYGLGERFEKALRFLQNFDFATAEQKKRYEIGDGMGFSIGPVQCTAPDSNEYEAHRKYADLQMVVGGCEYMGVADTSKLELHTDFEPDGDACFLRGDGDMIKLVTGDFVIFFPEDAHMPCRNDGVHECSSLKLVVKILL